VSAGIKASSHASGQARFRVAPGPGGRRRILAVVSIDGFPSRTQTATSFRVAPPHGPVVTGAQYRVKGTKLTIRWRRVGSVARYEVAVTLRHGMLPQYMIPARADSATVVLAPGVKARRVTVAAMGKNGLTGTVATAKLERTEPKPKPNPKTDRI